MRIALITHQFLPQYYTGVERLTLNLATQLRKLGHDTVVLTSAQHSSGDAAAYVYKGVRVRPIATTRVDLARPWLEDRSASSDIADVLDEDVDIVHVMHPMRLPQVFDEAECRGIPVVAHIADFWYLCARINLLRANEELCTDADGGRACSTICHIPTGPRRLRWAMDILSRARAVISPSRFAIDVHASQGFDTAHWHHVPWGVDYAVHPGRLPASTSNGLRIGFIGTLLAHKGPRVLVDAVRRLDADDITLLLYGDSFHESRYEAELRRRVGGDPRVRFEGSYDHAELPTILATLDVVAIPSLWHENLPTTGLNAVASGVPLIVSRVGGLTELVDDYDCGFTFRVGDADDLARLLESLRREPRRLERLRERIGYPPGVEEEAWRIEAVYADAVERDA